VARGFTLIEVVVALAVLCSGTVALAQLPLLAARANDRARLTTIAATMAVGKMEEIESMSWSELVPSPVASLVHNTPGYCDFLDDSGRLLATDTSPPSGSSFVRRWSVAPSWSNSLMVIQVAVTPIVADAIQAHERRRPEEVRLVSVKARR
jgi:prepilin-type N-terminal cleavage/methylation domain-containing protein